MCRNEWVRADSPRLLPPNSSIDVHHEQVDQALPELNQALAKRHKHNALFEEQLKAFESVFNEDLPLWSYFKRHSRFFVGSTFLLT